MNVRRHASVVTMILLGLSRCAIWSNEADSTVGHTAKTVQADLDVDSRTVLGVTLGESNLAEVEEKLGRTKLWSDGDASTAESKVCYITREPAAIVVMFASNAEMAGPPENSLTDIRIVRSAAYRQRSNCHPLAISGSDVVTKSGLRIGLSHAKTREILGTPTSTAGTRWKYSWSVDRPLPSSDKSYQHWLSRKEECFEGKDPFFTISSQIVVQFDDDGVIAISLRRIESIC